MKEKELRLQNDKLEKEYNLLFRDDIKRIFGRGENFELVICPSCGSNDCEEKFKKGIFWFCFCAACGTLYVNPRPSREQLGRFYSSSRSTKFYYEQLFPLSERARAKKIFPERAKMVSKIVKKYYPGKLDSLLEIGSGSGLFLQAARNLNLSKNYLAVEPTGGAAEGCRQRGFKVIEESFEELSLKGKIDLIVCFEVVEHLYKPGDLFKFSRKVLKKNGLLIITTPNINGFDLSVLGALSDNITGPNHLNFFNPFSLVALARKNNFQELEILTPGKLDVDIVKNKTLKGVLRVESLPFLGELIKNDLGGFNDNFQNFLQKNKLSSNLLGVFKKHG